jgi:lambda family phage portal protein
VALFGNLFAKAKPPAAPMPVRLRAKYDAAERGDDVRHWANSDAFAADAALSPSVRRTLRNRARYERANNSFLAGISSTLSYDLVGTGPRLQLNSGDTEVDRQVERAFFDWTWSVDLAGKLRTMREALVVDGEAFALMVNNPRLSGVQLDIRLVEAEMVATPTELMSQTITPEGNVVDGIEFDGIGNVIAYQVLSFHPGSNYRVNNLQFQRVPSAQMVHWFRAQRPGQHRGVPDVAPALRLFGQLRRYTEAVIAAAETAADFAAFLHSNSPAAEVDEVTAFAQMEIEKRSMVTLPEGWDISQLRAEQPTTQYPAFVRQILGEIGRCLNLPFNVAALDSSNYNYASGRMDHQIYGMTQRVDRDTLERVMLDRVLAAWVNEASLAGLLPEGLPPFSEWDWSWQWDGKDHVDPLKEASASETRLRTHTTTLAAEYAKAGKQWDVELRQRAAEVALMKELNLFVDFTPETNYGGTLDENGDPEGADA